MCFTRAIKCCDARFGSRTWIFQPTNTKIDFYLLPNCPIFMLPMKKKILLLGRKFKTIGDETKGIVLRWKAINSWVWEKDEIIGERDIKTPFSLENSSGFQNLSLWICMRAGPATSLWVERKKNSAVKNVCKPRQLYFQNLDYG